MAHWRTAAEAARYGTVRPSYFYGPAWSRQPQLNTPLQSAPLLFGNVDVGSCGCCMCQALVAAAPAKHHAQHFHDTTVASTTNLAYPAAQHTKPSRKNFRKEEEMQQPSGKVANYVEMDDELALEYAKFQEESKIFRKNRKMIRFEPNLSVCR